ncbi:hypothetical protein L1S32_06015 [Methanogenium sp. S4BF]|uniref:hypothetical protein n=1 Tax=Methanogenium sp. S4BF TaxID=1789226 RepID=UPI002415F052|nr:hypothetical protein [Methanogenium sp. S4BF]WFN35651.1 hypothetical protein L1S32_06015 [Methanogenium sp. S4BF]
MDTRKKLIAAAAGLAVLCICAAAVVPLMMSDDNGTGQVSSPTAAASSPVTTPDMGAGIPVSSPNEGLPTDTSVNAIGADEPVREGIPPDGMPEGMPEMDAGQIEEILDIMQENGIDTTEAREALENGDMDAVFAFIEENRPADMPPGGGPGDRPDGPPPA